MALLSQMVPNSWAGASSPLTIDVTKKPDPIPLILHGFTFVENILGVIQDDLKSYPHHLTVLPSRLTQHDDEAYRKPDLSVYQQHVRERSGYLVVGLCETHGSLLTIKFRITNIVTGDSKEAITVSMPVSQWRTLAHKVANSLYFFFTKKNGCFENHIMGNALLTSGRTGIYSIHQDGTLQNQVVAGDHTNDSIFANSLSQDGKYLVYLKDVSGADKTMLYIFDRKINGVCKTVPLPGIATSTSFIPNTSKVMIALNNGNLEFWSYDIASSTLARIKTSSQICISPNYHPSGSKFIFVGKTTGKCQIFVQEGGQVKQISRDPLASYFCPVWSPNGLWIAFIKRKVGKHYLGIMDGSGNERLIADGQGFDFPTWAPNSELIAFSAISKSERCIYIVNITGAFMRKIVFKSPIKQISKPIWM